MEIYTVNCNLNKISSLSIYCEFKKKGKLIEKKKYFVNTVYSWVIVLSWTFFCVCGGGGGTFSSERKKHSVVLW